MRADTFIQAMQAPSGKKRELLTKLYNKYFVRNEAGELVAQPDDPWFRNLLVKNTENYNDVKNEGAATQHMCVLHTCVRQE